MQMNLKSKNEISITFGWRFNKYWGNDKTVCTEDAPTTVLTAIIQIICTYELKIAKRNEMTGTLEKKTPSSGRN